MVRDLTHAELSDRFGRSLELLGRGVQAECRAVIAAMKQVSAQVVVLETKVDERERAALASRAELGTRIDGVLDLLLKEMRRGDAELHARVNSVRKGSKPSAEEAHQPADVDGAAALTRGLAWLASLLFKRWSGRIAAAVVALVSSGGVLTMCASRATPADTQAVRVEIPRPIPTVNVVDLETGLAVTLRATND